jgi:hypothetical protein
MPMIWLTTDGPIEHKIHIAVLEARVVLLPGDDDFVFFHGCLPFSRFPVWILIIVLNTKHDVDILHHSQNRPTVNCEFHGSVE